MLALTYKWTVPEIDSLTWPLIMRLFKKIQETPPIDLLAMGLVKGMKAKPIGQQIGTFGGKMKKGKVKRRD